MLSTWYTGLSQQAVKNASRLVSWVSVRDIDSYELLTPSHRVSHAVNIDGLHSSGRNRAKPRVHGEHAMGEADLQEMVGGVGGVEVEWGTESEPFHQSSDAVKRISKSSHNTLS